MKPNRILSLSLSAIFLSMAIMASPPATAESELDPKYFANESLQRQSPSAFALQPESKDFLNELILSAPLEKGAFLKLIHRDEGLVKSIVEFGTLAPADQEAVLRKVFRLEVEAMGIKAPALVIESGSIPGSAFFEFDIVNPGSGTVFLNPEQITREANPYLSLLLLIHETRHSAQFQRAFSLPLSESPMNVGFRAAFRAQKTMSIQSFSDFLTLVNEYEAFQFGNFIVGSLTNFQTDTLGLGTLASQYDNNGKLKIDLLDLFKKSEAGELSGSVLEAFNELEKTQYELLKRSSLDIHSKGCRRAIKHK